MEKSSQKRRQVVVVGGGIAGLTIAIALRKAGYEPLVFEAAEKLKPVGAGLGLAANAIHALDKLGIKEKVLARGRLLPSFSIKDEKGRIIIHTDSKKISERLGLDNFTIHRAALHDALLSELPAGTVITGKQCTGTQQDEEPGACCVHFKDGSRYTAAYVIAADGIHSAVRQELVPVSLPRFAGYTCWRAVVDNSGLQVKDSYEIWGKKGRFGVVPLSDNQLYWFATINAAQDDPRFKNFQVSDLVYWFKNYPSELRQVLEATPAPALIWNDIMDIKPLPQYAFGNILLAGDAAHATTPNMGQGACQAMEDAAVLYDELAAGKELQAAFTQFEKRRLSRTHAVIRQSARIGKIAQSAHPVIIAVRNALFRAMPERVQYRQIKQLYKTDF